LTNTQLHYLHLGIPRVQAKRELHLRNSESELTEDRVYNIMYAMTDDEDKAERTRSEFTISKSRARK